MYRTLIGSVLRSTSVLSLAAAGCLLLPQMPSATAADLYPLFGSAETDNGTDLGQVNFFADATRFSVDVTAVDEGNNFAVYTMGGGDGNGAGFSVGVSNGENGISSTEGGANMDVDNAAPVSSVISDANGGNGAKLQNGNVIRFSAWMRQDPNDPVTAVPQIEPVMKIEVWKEALSGNADFNPALFPGFGDRIWDTDQNAGQPAHQAAGQSQASWVDMNNSGSTSFDKPVAQSLVTDEWRLVETTLVIDDDPLDDGFGWSIGAEFFDVTAIEELRGVVFFGEFTGADLTDAGSIWVDNILFEIFPDEASVTANANPMPMAMMTEVLFGDADNDLAVSGSDLLAVTNNFGSTGEADGLLLGDADDDGAVSGSDLLAVTNSFGATLSGGLESGTNVPEPTSVALVTLGIAGLLCVRSRK